MLSRFLCSVIFLVAVSSASSAIGATYSCTPIFGETVPLRKVIFKAGASCPECLSKNFEIPPKLIDTSSEWNKRVRTLSSQTSEIKRRYHTAGDRVIWLETRYVTQNGRPFRIEVTCSQVGPKKCKGQFLGEADSRLIKLKHELADSRLPNSIGEAEISISDRDDFGWIVRLTKTQVKVDSNFTVPVSGSGEIRIFREDPKFIHDTGVDEQLELYKGSRTRLAALELKIRCQKESK